MFFVMLEAHCKIRVSSISSSSVLLQMHHVYCNIKNFEFLVMVIKSKCSRHVIKIWVWRIHASFKCEESTPFSYKCANSQDQTWFVRLSDRSQIGLESSESKKCSQRFEIAHFRPGSFSALQPSDNCYEFNRGSFRFTDNIRYTCKTKLKFEKFGIGGWCVASCTSIQCSKFSVQA